MNNAAVNTDAQRSVQVPALIEGLSFALQIVQHHPEITSSKVLLLVIYPGL